MAVTQAQIRRQCEVNAVVGRQLSSDRTGSTLQNTECGIPREKDALLPWRSGPCAMLQDIQGHTDAENENSGSSRPATQSKEPVAFQPKFDSHEIYAQADQETQHFIEATIKYQNSIAAKDPKYKPAIDWDHSHTWEEVIEEIDRAATLHYEPSGVWGKIRKAFRSVGNRHSVFQPWLHFLPAQSPYFSVICGGLKLILGVCGLSRTARACR